MTTESDIKNFLLVYNRRTGTLEERLSFGNDADAALARYRDLEREHRSDRSYDIVLVGADSIDSVMITHSNYFLKGEQDLEGYLQSMLDASGVSM
ncbi:hypothetical protein HMPREF1531_00904 [Propionibacterium sp. oral taxon 192 str. F0372]|uniref:hypothetical protein n=1 Tax=Propionibacterium sp. oral taxon 192 TaxID=671222 RepID=UPI0003528AFF|nr:hypothetical protein [Propionibacterium sp. oral taxon 192]EPH06254.1 hypothetical protein HMPREF1531_00904 [Propionibacterium sp. oral taxon 192 str. F0372]